MKFLPKSFPRIVGLLLVGLMSLSGIAIYLWISSRPRQSNLEAQTALAKVQDLHIRIHTSGSVVPVQEVNLSPKAAGRLVKLYVDQGDRVIQGQALAQMDDRDLRVKLRQQQANLALAEAFLAEAIAGSRTEEITQAQAQVRAIQAQAELTQSRSVRNQQLFQRGAISRDQLQQVLTNERNTQANLQQAQQKLLELRKGNRSEVIVQERARVAQARAQLQAVQVQMEDTIIRAPFLGMITQKYANVGAFVTPTTSASATTSATSTSIVAIANQLEILAKVPETDVAQLEPNQRVQIVADAFPGRTFQGRVRLIAPEAVVEQNVTSFEVRVALNTGQSQLRSGMNVDLTFLGDNLKNTLVVPTVAIVVQKGQHGVLIPDTHQQPRFHPVTIGSTVDEQTQIIRGLRPGERIFVNLFKVPDKERR